MDSSTNKPGEVVYKQYKLVHEFKEFLNAGNVFSKNTIKNYLSDIRHYLGFVHSCFPEIFASGTFADSQIIYEYRHYLIGSLKSSITVKRRLSAVNKFTAFIDQNVETHGHSGAATSPTHTRIEPEGDFGALPRTSPSRGNFYLNSLLQEYAHDKKITPDSKNSVRDFLLFVHR